jgi:hypothetical protein
MLTTDKRTKGDAQYLCPPLDADRVSLREDDELAVIKLALELWIILQLPL